MGVLRQAQCSDWIGMHRVRLSVTENRLTSAVLTESDYAVATQAPGRGWVVDVDGHTVAFAVGNGETGNIWALFVDPAYEGRGYGRNLLAAMTSWLWEEGLERLWLTTEAGTRAETFYQRAGWNRTAATEGGEVRFELSRPY